eukprot:sb/3463035/
MLSDTSNRHQLLRQVKVCRHARPHFFGKTLKSGCLSLLTIRSFGARDGLGLTVRVWLGFGLGGRLGLSILYQMPFNHDMSDFESESVRIFGDACYSGTLEMLSDITELKVFSDFVKMVAVFKTDWAKDGCLQFYKRTLPEPCYDFDAYWSYAILGLESAVKYSDRRLLDCLLSCVPENKTKFVFRISRLLADTTKKSHLDLVMVMAVEFNLVDQFIQQSLALLYYSIPLLQYWLENFNFTLSGPDTLALLAEAVELNTGSETSCKLMAALKEESEMTIEEIAKEDENCKVNVVIAIDGTLATVARNHWNKIRRRREKITSRVIRAAPTKPFSPYPPHVTRTRLKTTWRTHMVMDTTYTSRMKFWMVRYFEMTMIKKSRRGTIQIHLIYMSDFESESVRIFGDACYSGTLEMLSDITELKVFSDFVKMVAVFKTDWAKDGCLQFYKRTLPEPCYDFDAYWSYAILGLESAVKYSDRRLLDCLLSCVPENKTKFVFRISRLLADTTKKSHLDLVMVMAVEFNLVDQFIQQSLALLYYSIPLLQYWLENFNFTLSGPDTLALLAEAVELNTGSETSCKLMAALKEESEMTIEEIAKEDENCKVNVVIAIDGTCGSAFRVRVVQLS